MSASVLDWPPPNTSATGPWHFNTTTVSPPPITEVDFETSLSVGKIGAALAKAQKKIAHAKADSANPYFSSRYADLATVIDAVRDPLAENEIARTQFPLSRDGEVGLLTMLIHSSGEWIRGRVFCKPLQAGPQALGSVITYLRRYSLAAAVGLAQEDDDANSADAPKAPTPERLSKSQQAEIKILQGELKIPVDEWRLKLAKHFEGKTSSAQLTPDEARKLIGMLEQSKAARTSPPAAAPSNT